MNKSPSADCVQGNMPNEKKEKGPSKALAVLGVIACIILIPILILNIVLIAQGFTADKSNVPNIGGYFPLMVQSGSMSGTIETGDLIIAHTADNPTALKEGDIVVYWEGQPGGTLITHRIIEVTKDSDGSLAYRTKGDANVTEDARLLSPENVVGTYNSRIPLMGDVAMFMQTIPGLIVCVVIPLALFIIYDILRRRHIDKSKKSETAALLEELEALKSAKAELEAAKNNKTE